MRQLAWIWTLQTKYKLVTVQWAPNEQSASERGPNLPEGLDVVGTVGTAGEVRQVELNLIPALVESHGHGADEGLDAGCALVVGGAEATAHVLVVQDLHLEGEVLLQVLDDHHEEGKLDGEGLLGVDGAGNEVGRDVGAHDFEDRGLNVGVGDSLDVAVSHVLVPNLEGLRTTRTLRLATTHRSRTPAGPNPRARNKHAGWSPTRASRFENTYPIE
jgi:hypothetical protein